MTSDRTHDHLTERIATPRTETFDLPGRMRGMISTSVELAPACDRLQGVANELGAVETLISGRASR